MQLEEILRELEAAGYTVGGEQLATPEAAEYVNDGWNEVRPLVEWLNEYVGDSEKTHR